MREQFFKVEKNSAMDNVHKKPINGIQEPFV
jgi:hypothetical protein